MLKIHFKNDNTVVVMDHVKEAVANFKITCYTDNNQHARVGKYVLRRVEEDVWHCNFGRVWKPVCITDTDTGDIFQLGLLNIDKYIWRESKPFKFDFELTGYNPPKVITLDHIRQAFRNELMTVDYQDCSKYYSVGNVTLRVINSGAYIETTTSNIWRDLYINEIDLQDTQGSVSDYLKLGFVKDA